MSGTSAARSRTFACGKRWPRAWVTDDQRGGGVTPLRPRNHPVLEGCASRLSGTPDPKPASRRVRVAGAGVLAAAPRLGPGDRGDTADRDRERAADAVRLMAETDRIQAQIERLQMRARMDHRPRALAHSLFVNRMRRILNPRAWTCVKSPPRAGRTIAATDSPDDAPAMRHEIGCRAQRYFLRATIWRSTPSCVRRSSSLNDLPDGESSLAAQFGALSTMIYYGNA